MPARLLKILIAAAAYFLLAWISTKTNATLLGPTPIWPPSGFALALLILGGREMWPAIVLGSVASVLTLSRDPITLIGFTAANTAEPLVAAWMLGYPRRFQISFSRLKDAFLYVSIIGVACVTVGGVLGALTLCFSGTVPWTNFPNDWFRWWVPNLVADALLTPVILTLASNGLKNSAMTLRNIRELIFEFSVLLVFVYFAYTPHYSRTSTALALVYFSFSLIVAISLRWNLRIGSIALLFTSIFAIWNTLNGNGPYAMSTASDNILSVQLSCTLAGVILILLCSLISEQRQAVEEAKNAVQVREEFLLVASHELNTPLTSLKLQSQFLRELVKKNALNSYPPERLSSLIRITEQQINRLTELVGDLLDSSRIGSRRFKIEAGREVNLSEIVRCVVERYSSESDQLSSRVELELDDRIKGPWDSRRIDQVVVNLLSNALKYGNGNPIRISTEIIENCACLKVKDQGIGIAAEDRDRIFDRFVRASKITAYPGIGLGLYITREIIEAHKGSIHVESEPGAGSMFVVRLPLNLP